jgi:hypothetical protein
MRLSPFCSFLLRDQYRMADRDLSFDQRLRFELGAPIIVAGRVVEVNEIGQPQPSGGDRRIKCQLTRIRADVDEVIKGDVGSNQIEFYYFTYSPMASEVDLGALRCFARDTRLSLYCSGWPSIRISGSRTERER